MKIIYQLENRTMEKNIIDFKKMNGLIPAIIQDAKTKDIYMLGYMNEETLEMTRNKGMVYFWSRSKKRVWMKGEVSGNVLKVRTIYIDCDRDTLLILVELVGNAVCHTEKRTCFNEELFVRFLPPQE